MHLNWRPQTNVSNIPPFPQNTSFCAASCTDQLITWLQNWAGHHSSLRGGKAGTVAEESLHLQPQPGQHCKAASQQLSRPERSKLKEKQKTQTTKQNQSTPAHPEFPHKAIINPYSHAWLQTQNQCAASAGLGCCLITLHITSARNTLLIVLGNTKRECNFYASSPNSMRILFCCL